MKARYYALLVGLSLSFHLLWFLRLDPAPHSAVKPSTSVIGQVVPLTIPHPLPTAATLLGDGLRVVLFGPEKPEPVYCLEVLEPVEVVAPRPLPVPSVSSPFSAGRTGEE